MTNNPNQPPEPQDQTSNNQSWNAIDLGLQPLNIFELIMKNFVKALSFNFGWDYTNNIWRRLSVNTDGQLITNGSTQKPITQYVNQDEITPTYALLITANAARVAFMIMNNDTTDGGPTVRALITLGNPDDNLELFLEAGYAYYDDLWQGDVYIKTDGISNFTFIRLIEYSR